MWEKVNMSREIVEWEHVKEEEWEEASYRGGSAFESFN